MSEVKLISNIFAIPLIFLIQLKNLLKNTKNILNLYYYKNCIKCQQGGCFLFKCFIPDDILKEITRLDIKRKNKRVIYLQKNKAGSKSNCGLLH